jgi:hypothetical protein
MLVGCSSKPEIKYVEKIVEVEKPTPKQLTSLCNIPKRDGDKVRDYIVSENRLYNALVICNLKIEARNNEK